MSEIDTSPEAVKRWDISPYDQYSVEQRECETGDWVDYDDYAALSAKLQAAEAERKDAMLRLSEMRMCVNCGRKTGVDHNRHMPLLDCPSPDACTFGLTPDEAWQHWRQKAHDDRARAEAAEAERDALKAHPDLSAVSAMANSLACAERIIKRERVRAEAAEAEVARLREVVKSAHDFMEGDYDGDALLVLSAALEKAGEG